MQGRCIQALLTMTLLVLLSNCQNADVVLTTPPHIGTPTRTAQLPAFSHIYVIVMENKEVDKIIGNGDAPYINGLAARYGFASEYYGIAHPSQPNYLAMISGWTYNITDDSPHNIDMPNLADQLDAHGKTWRVYEQNVPNGCFTDRSSQGGADGPGEYARKHNPFISFTSISGNPSRCGNITDFSAFDPAAADFEFIVPNQTDDMHDGSIAQGDAALQALVPRILNSAAFQQDGLLIVTWDEGNSNLNGGGHVPTLVVSPRTPAGAVSSERSNHYTLLRTIEDAWGLGCLGDSCAANNLAAFFR
jgi:hypothetical protein